MPYIAINLTIMRLVAEMQLPKINPETYSIMDNY